MSASATDTRRSDRVQPTHAPEQVLVVGVGNLLVGDEGIGAHVVQQLLKHPWPEHVEILEAGAGGCELLRLMQSAPRVILIDATHDGLWPGSVTHFRVQDPSDFPPALGEHDVGLKALLTAAALVGDMPEVEVITISVDETKPMEMELSIDVAAALPEVERLIRQLIA